MCIFVLGRVKKGGGKKDSLSKDGVGNDVCPPGTQHAPLIQCSTFTQEELDIDRQVCCLRKVAKEDMKRRKQARRGFRSPFPVLKTWL